MSDKPPPRASAGVTFLEGIDKVTGRCQYTFDLRRPGMLAGKLLYPPFPRARILRLDTQRAAAMPGVRAVVTHRDIPGEKRFGYIVKDQPVLAVDEVCYVGDIVAAVAAVDEDAAQAALDAIDVEYEPLDGIFDATTALAPTAPPARSDLANNVLSHTVIDHGNIDLGFAQADVVVEQSYSTAAVEQLCMEPEGAIAEWDGTSLTIFCGGQYPHRDRMQIAEIMGLPANRVRVIYPAVGGGFGAKDELHVQVPTALLAWKAGCPVKLVRTRSESMTTHVKRQRFSIRYRTGARSDGTLTAVQARLVLDAGPYTNASGAVAGFAAEMASGPYCIPHAHIEAYAVATNNQAGGAMRGFGGPEAAFAQEQNLDLVARKLGMDPLELRLKNGMEKGTTMPTGAHIYYDIGLKETLRQAASAADWFNRDRWLERRPAPPLRRGLGVATIWHGMGIGRNLLDRGDIALEMLPDGSVLLATGYVEMGQGTNTAQALMVARELGVRPENVRVITPDTHVTPDAGTTTASRATYMAGNAIHKAAAPIREALLQLAAAELETVPEDLDLANGRITSRQGPPERSVTIADMAMRAWHANKQLRATGPVEMWQPDHPRCRFNYPVPHSIFLYATHIAQVLVDTTTGQVKVEKVWAAHDVGKIVNRLGIEGQIDGGIVQGVGTALMEQLQESEGRVLNGTLETYLVPLATEAPEVEHVLVEVPEPSGPGGAKGVGEATLNPVAAAVANAVADAVGVRLHTIPMTPERVLGALRCRDVETDAPTAEDYTADAH
jgi:CO/xanthine dehydrogenase Mo-binding subunit